MRRHPHVTTARRPTSTQSAPAPYCHRHQRAATAAAAAAATAAAAACNRRRRSPGPPSFTSHQSNNRPRHDRGHATSPPRTSAPPPRPRRQTLHNQPFRLHQSTWPGGDRRRPAGGRRAALWPDASGGGGGGRDWDSGSRCRPLVTSRPRYCRSRVSRPHLTGEEWLRGDRGLGTDGERGRQSAEGGQKVSWVS